MRISLLLASAVVLVACDPVPGGVPGGSTGSSSGEGPFESTSGPRTFDPSSTAAEHTSSSGEASQGGSGSTSLQGTAGSTSTGCLGCGETTGPSEGSVGSSQGSVGSTDTGGSSSTGDTPVTPIDWPADWVASFDAFEGYSLEALDDGTIVVGGAQDGIGMVYVMDSEGNILWTHTVDPMQWGEAVAPEVVTGLAVLGPTRLAVLISRGSSEADVTFDGVLELDLETHAVGWSTLILAPEIPPVSWQEHNPVTARQLVTTTAGDLFVAGVGWATDDSKIPLSPWPSPWSSFWAQRLEPTSGARIWGVWYPTGSYSFGLTQYQYRLLIHEVSERLLLQANNLSKSSGSCFWRERDLLTGASIHPTDFTLDTHYEYCGPAKTLSDGTTAAPAGFFAGNDENHIHAAGPGGSAEYALDTTDFRRVHSMYIDADDTVYVTGALREPWQDVGAPLGFGRLTLESPPSAEVLLTWATEAEYRELRAVDFGLAGEVLMLYRGPSGSVLQQHSAE